ncbi:unnamed protein product [Polarella glacialis]|uniref:Uncharacterized protein n=1 Tax=Polarella glacialis TaxID=89957 RepID=A0A813LE32_POLGL|nr:unnamed protein product [Polarella glacialis]
MAGGNTKKAVAKAPAGKAEQEVDAQKLRLVKLIEEVGEKAPANLRPHIRTAAPYLATVWVYFTMALPYVIQGIQITQELLAKLPEKILWAFVGFLVCFFGGVFPATIAAVEAWQLCGGKEALVHVAELWNEFQKVQDASKKDDDADADKDGKADVSEMTPQQLVQRKIAVAMMTVEPERISTAVGGLYIGWVGVLAILKIQFAKTVTLGEIIGGAIYKPASKFEPMIETMVPQEYSKWVPVGLRWTIKLMAISTAWMIQRVISAIHSSIRGGLMFGKYLVDYLHETGYLKAETKDTYIDEAIGWGVAFLGFLTQCAFGFHVPFLFNIFLWPLQLVEAIVVYSVAY